MAEALNPQPNIRVDVERARPQISAILFSEYINRSHEGKTNLLGVFDRITLPRDAKSTPEFFVFVRTYKVGAGLLQITVFDPTDQPVAGAGFDVTDDHLGSAIVSHIQVILKMKFQVQGDGVYWFDVSHNGVSLGGEALRVSIDHSLESDGMETTLAEGE